MFSWVLILEQLIKNEESIPLPLLISMRTKLPGGRWVPPVVGVQDGVSACPLKGCVCVDMTALCMSAADKLRRNRVTLLREHSTTVF